MDISEFLNREPVEEAEVVVAGEEPEEIDVQKAVVESLAADKAEQDEVISTLKESNARQDELISSLKEGKAEQEIKIGSLRANNAALQSEVNALKKKLEKALEELTRIGDTLAKNSESKLSSKVALLERNVELEDRFEGETRDHVIEVLREARDAAEKGGRCRRAQVLESVLVANEPHGELAKRRVELEKLFSDNANLVSGTVIQELEKRGISHKNGEEYLLPSEIIARNY